jgi:hypothetical protein
MAKLLTMPDLTWAVRVFDGSNQWVWEYKFTRIGNKVSWRDTWNGMHGNGTWRIEGDKMKTSWSGSATTEEWDVPIDPSLAKGTCVMKGKEYKLEAVAQGYFLQPGDVVYSGTPLFRVTVPSPATIIYELEVRSGGTIAWICNNPGNIQAWTDWAEHHGAYKGKHLDVPSVKGRYAIFPDRTAGLKAIGSVLRGYPKGFTIREAIFKYAPPEHGNNPEAYTKQVRDTLKLPDDTLLKDLNEMQILQMVTTITRVEDEKTGDTWPRNSTDLPNDIRQRLSPP